jgi:hypothetical protein
MTKLKLPDCCSNACEKPALTEKIAVVEKIMAEQNKVLALAHATLVLAAKGMADRNKIEEAIAAIVGDKAL